MNCDNDIFTIEWYGDWYPDRKLKHHTHWTHEEKMGTQSIEFCVKDNEYRNISPVIAKCYCYLIYLSGVKLFDAHNCIAVFRMHDMEVHYGETIEIKDIIFRSRYRKGYLDASFVSDDFLKCVDYKIGN